MGKCCSKQQTQNEARQINGLENHNVIVNNKLFNQDILVRKRMKSGGQLGRTGDGDFEVGFQVMFQKRKIKKYSAAPSVPQIQSQDTNAVS